MLAIKVVSILTIACILIDIISLIVIVKGKKEGILALLVSLITTAISWGTLDVPKPEIFPVSEIIQKNPYEVTIVSEGNLDIYYTIDGRDPKAGNRYQSPIEISEPVTVAARTKYLFAWSDIEKITYNVDFTTKKILNEDNQGENLYDESHKDAEDLSKKGEGSFEEEADDSDSDEEIPYYQFVGENHTPNGPAEIVEVSTWQKDKDYAIDGTTYDGGIKVYISYMISSFFGNGAGTSKDFTSEIHLALNQDAVSTLPIENQKFGGKIVINKETEGSPSTAIVSILVDGEELYNSGEFDCYSLDIPEFSVDVSGKKEIVIKTICHQSGNPFVFGIVNRD